MRLIKNEISATSIFFTGIKFCVGIFLLLISFRTSAQNISQALQEDIVLGRLMAQADSTALEHSKNSIYPKKSSISASYHLLDALSFDKVSFQNSRLTEVIAEKEAASNDIGLSFRSSYRENIEEGIFTGGDIFYIRRFNTGIQWDFLNNGWLESNERAEELEIRERIVRRDLNQQQAVDQYERLYNRIIYAFNLRKIQLSEKYLKAVSTNLTLMQRLHYLDFEPWEKVLELTSLKARLENDLTGYKKYNQQFDKSVTESFLRHIQVRDVKKLPILHIDIDSLATVNNEKFADQALTEEDLEELDYNVLSDISLSAYADYNIYGGIGNVQGPENFGGREYFSVGVDISIPLPLNTNEKQKIADARKKSHLNNQQNEKFSETKEIYNHYYEYRYKKQQYIQLYKEYQTRQEVIDNHLTLKKLDDPGFSTQHLMKAVLQRYAIALELTGIKQQMYLLLINIDKYVTDKSILDFTTPADIPSLFPEEFVKAGGIYIWSETFASTSNETLSLFLQKMGAKNVYVSLGTDNDLFDKANLFVQIAGEEGVRVHMLVGNNQLIEGNQQVNEMHALAEKAERLDFQGIHFDVEPHTFEDWEEQRSSYEQDYVNMVRSAQNIFKEYDLSFSVSIPHFYDSIISEIGQASDEIVVMVYGTDQIEVLQSRIEKEREVAAEKLSVAIRADDFQDIDHLNSFINEILKTTNVNGVFIHDAGNFMNIQSPIK